MDLYAGIYLYFFNVEKFSFLLSSSELNFVSEITPWPHHSLDRECSNTFWGNFLVTLGRGLHSLRALQFNFVYNTLSSPLFRLFI